MIERLRLTREELDWFEFNSIEPPGESIAMIGIFPPLLPQLGPPKVLGSQPCETLKRTLMTNSQLPNKQIARATFERTI